MLLLLATMANIFHEIDRNIIDAVFITFVAWLQTSQKHLYCDTLNQELEIYKK